MTSTPTPCLDLNDIVCRDLEASRHITPGTPPTLSPEFLTQEAAYLARLTQQPPTPEMTSTPTPDPYLLAVLPAEREGFVQIRVRNGYGVLFQMEYTPEVWEREGTTLAHRQLPGCTLQLTAGGGEARGPLYMGQTSLAGYPFMVRYFPEERLLAYALNLAEGFYLFQVTLPPGASDREIKSCRTSAELVLDTFAPIADKAALTPAKPSPPVVKPKTTPAQEGWSTYQTPFFSLQYPSGWQVEDRAMAGWSVAFYPTGDPLEDGQSKVEIVYLGQEIPEREDLQAWYTEYLRTLPTEGPRPEISKIRSQTLAHPDGSQREVLYVVLTSEWGPSQRIILTHGRLALAVVTPVLDERMTQILWQIAQSIEFTPHAPRTINELLSARG